MSLTNITSKELFDAGRWTEFLSSLGVGMTDWVVVDYRDISKIRVTATILSKEDGRGYSIKVAKENGLHIYIEVTKKKKTTIIPE